MINEDSQKHDLKTGAEKKQSPGESKEITDKVTGLTEPIMDDEHLMNMFVDDSPSRKEKTEESATNKDAVLKLSKMTESNYYRTFFKIPKENASKGRTVYIRPEYHQKFLKLIAGLEIERLTIYAYVDNIIEHHFKHFDELIQKIYQDRNKPLF